MFYRFKTFDEKLFDKFIWPQLPPPTNKKNLATALLSSLALRMIPEIERIKNARYIITLNKINIQQKMQYGSLFNKL